MKWAFFTFSLEVSWLFTDVCNSKSNEFCLACTLTFTLGLLLVTMVLNRVVLGLYEHWAPSKMKTYEYGLNIKSFCWKWCWYTYLLSHQFLYSVQKGCKHCWLHSLKYTSWNCKTMVVLRRKCSVEGLNVIFVMLPQLYIMFE